MAASSFFRLIGDIAWARLMAEQPSPTCKEKEKIDRLAKFPASA
jgi:hypothetical protein